jgi:hypothetical protein
MRRSVSRLAATATVILGVVAGVAAAQQQTTTTETKAFKVISVEGNELVVRLPEGTRAITVPEDFRFTVNGQSLSVHELTPGMSGTAEIKTTTTVKPVTVTEVRNATVEQVSGASIIVRGQNGFRVFTQGEVDKRNIKIVKDGRPVTLSELHTGDHLTATIVTEKPPQVMTEKQVLASLAAGGPEKVMATTGSKAPEPAAAPTPAVAAASASTPASTPAEPATTLPKTASASPLLGLIGVLSTALAVTMRLRRRG